MSQAIDDLKAAVERDRTVTASAVTLLGELAKLLSEAANSGDLEEVKKLAADFNANSDALAAAVTANTPPAPPAPAPAPDPNAPPP